MNAVTSQNSGADSAAAHLAPGSRRPIRILAVCNTWQGANDYAFVRAFRRAGHSVRVVSDESYFPCGWRNPVLKAFRRAAQPIMTADYERALITEAQQLRPDLFFVFKGRFVTPAAIDAVRATGAAAVNFYPDIDFAGHGPNIPKAISLYDWVFTSKSFHLKSVKTELDLAKSSYLPHAFDPETHSPAVLDSVDRERYGCEASFIGTWTPKKEELLMHLARTMPKLSLRIWGNEWRNARANFGDAVMNEPVSGTEYSKAIGASGINIAILREGRPGFACGDLTTARTFEIPAAGGFMLHERTDEAKGFFTEDVECAMFADGAELVKKVDYYLTHRDARGRIAKAGHERCLNSGYSVDGRVKSILAKFHEMRK